MIKSALCYFFWEVILLRLRLLNNLKSRGLIWRTQWSRIKEKHMRLAELITLLSFFTVSHRATGSLRLVQ